MPKDRVNAMKRFTPQARFLGMLTFIPVRAEFGLNQPCCVGWRDGSCPGLPTVTYFS
jgi:hypothetical protein